jgi:hypothetical protein
VSIHKTIVAPKREVPLASGDAKLDINHRWCVRKKWGGKKIMTGDL